MEIITSRPKHYRTKTSLKSVHITAKEWFDRVNGNSYFSCQVIVNNKYKIVLPFDYGYGDHFVDMACKELVKLGLTDKDLYCWGNREGISFESVKVENCLKREVKSFGEI